MTYDDPFPMRPKPTSWKPCMHPVRRTPGGPVEGWQCTLSDGSKALGATPVEAHRHATRASNLGLRGVRILKW